MSQKPTRSIAVLAQAQEYVDQGVPIGEGLFVVSNAREPLARALNMGVSTLRSQFPGEHPISLAATAIEAITGDKALANGLVIARSPVVHEAVRDAVASTTLANVLDTLPQMSRDDLRVVYQQAHHQLGHNKPIG